MCVLCLLQDYSIELSNKFAKTIDARVIKKNLRYVHLTLWTTDLRHKGDKDEYLFFKFQGEPY